MAGGILRYVRFKKSAQVFTVAGGRTAIDAVSPLSVGGPLKGGSWVAVYVLDRDGSHRRQVYTVDGVDRIPGRYAIDFMPAPGTMGIGAEVLATAPRHSIPRLPYRPVYAYAAQLMTSHLGPVAKPAMGYRLPVPASALRTSELRSYARRVSIAYPGSPSLSRLPSEYRRRQVPKPPALR